MDVDRLRKLETIDPRPLPPWRTNAFTEIELENDRGHSRAGVSRHRMTFFWFNMWETYRCTRLDTRA